ncbi:MAG TPA: hypothetical protein VI306_17020, partial [Pyrinomonadaceae bacterium]
ATALRLIIQPWLTQGCSNPGVKTFRAVATATRLRHLRFAANRNRVAVDNFRLGPPRVAATLGFET